MLTGCKNDPGSTTGATEATGSSTTASEPTQTSGDKKVKHTISVSSKGGLPLADVTIFVYADEKMENLAGYGITDETGSLSVELTAGRDYRIAVASAPDGYVSEEYYTFTGTNADLLLESQIISDSDLSGVTYTLGSVMHDFTVTDCDGVTHTLSEILKEKKLVMYLGAMMEFGTKADIFANPLHPYTKALFSAIPNPNPDAKMNRIVLNGDIPSPANPPKGCRFHTRCPYAKEICKHVTPEYREHEPGHFAACHLLDEEHTNG